MPDLIKKQEELTDSGTGNVQAALKAGNQAAVTTNIATNVDFDAMDQADSWSPHAEVVKTDEGSGFKVVDNYASNSSNSDWLDTDTSSDWYDDSGSGDNFDTSSNETDTLFPYDEGLDDGTVTVDEEVNQEKESFEDKLIPTEEAEEEEEGEEKSTGVKDATSLDQSEEEDDSEVMKGEGTYEGIELPEWMTEELYQYENGEELAQFLNNLLMVEDPEYSLTQNYYKDAAGGEVKDGHRYYNSMEEYEEDIAHRAASVMEWIDQHTVTKEDGKQYITYAEEGERKEQIFELAAFFQDEMNVIKTTDWSLIYDSDLPARAHDNYEHFKEIYEQSGLTEQQLLEIYKIDSYFLKHQDEASGGNLWTASQQYYQENKEALDAAGITANGAYSLFVDAQNDANENRQFREYYGQIEKEKHEQRAADAAFYWNQLVQYDKGCQKLDAINTDPIEETYGGAMATAKEALNQAEAERKAAEDAYQSAKNTYGMFSPEAKEAKDALGKAQEAYDAVFKDYSRAEDNYAYLIDKVEQENDNRKYSVMYFTNDTPVEWTESYEKMKSALESEDLTSDALQAFGIEQDVSDVYLAAMAVESAEGSEAKKEAAAKLKILEEQTGISADKAKEKVEYAKDWLQNQMYRAELEPLTAEQREHLQTDYKYIQQGRAAPYGDGNIRMDERLAAIGENITYPPSEDFINDPDAFDDIMDAFDCDYYYDSAKDKYVVIPTLIQNESGEWVHVNRDDAVKHYQETGEYFGQYDKQSEAVSAWKNLSTSDNTNLLLSDYWQNQINAIDSNMDFKDWIDAQIHGSKEEDDYSDVRASVAASGTPEQQEAYAKAVAAQNEEKAAKKAYFEDQLKRYADEKKPAIASYLWAEKKPGAAMSDEDQAKLNVLNNLIAQDNAKKGNAENTAMLIEYVKRGGSLEDAIAAAKKDLGKPLDEVKKACNEWMDNYLKESVNQTNYAIWREAVYGDYRDLSQDDLEAAKMQFFLESNPEYGKGLLFAEGQAKEQYDAVQKTYDEQLENYIIQCIHNDPADFRTHEQFEKAFNEEKPELYAELQTAKAEYEQAHKASESKQNAVDYYKSLRGQPLPTEVTLETFPGSDYTWEQLGGKMMTDQQKDPDYDEKVQNGMQIAGNMVQTIYDWSAKSPYLVELFGQNPDGMMTMEAKDIGMFWAGKGKNFNGMGVEQMLKESGMDDAQIAKFKEEFFGMNQPWLLLPNSDWTFKEIETYSYYLGNNDVETALEYAYDQNSKYAGYNKAERAQAVAEWAENTTKLLTGDGNAWDKIKGLAWVATNALTSGAPNVMMVSTAEAIGEFMQYATNGRPGVSYGLGPTEFFQALTEGTTKAIDEAVPYQLLINDVAYTAGDIYGAILSSIESWEVKLVGNAVLPGASEWYTNLAFGGGAFLETVDEAYQRTGDIKKALTEATCAFVAEGLFETVSLEVLADKIIPGITGGWSWALNSGVYSLVEGSEEMATFLANYMVGEIVSGDNSKYMDLYHQYLDDGFTEAQAEKMVKDEWKEEITKSTASGFFSAGPSVALHGGKVYLTTKSEGQKANDHGLTPILCDAVIDSLSTPAGLTDAELGIAPEIETPAAAPGEAPVGSPAKATAESLQAEESAEESAERPVVQEEAPATEVHAETPAAQPEAADQINAVEDMWKRSESQTASERAAEKGITKEQAQAELDAEAQVREILDKDKISSDDGRKIAKTPELQAAYERLGFGKLTGFTSDMVKQIREANAQHKAAQAEAAKAAPAEEKEAPAKEEEKPSEPASIPSKEQFDKQQEEKSEPTPEDKEPEKKEPEKWKSPLWKSQQEKTIEKAKALKKEYEERHKAQAEKAVKLQAEIEELRKKQADGTITKNEQSKLEYLIREQKSNSDKLKDLSVKVGQLLREFAESSPEAYKNFVLDNFDKAKLVIPGDATRIGDEKKASLFKDANFMATLVTREEHPDAIVLDNVGTELQEKFGLTAEQANSVQDMLTRIVNGDGSLHVKDVYEFAKGLVDEKVKHGVISYVNSLFSDGTIKIAADGGASTGNASSGSKTTKGAVIPAASKNSSDTDTTDAGEKAPTGIAGLLGNIQKSLAKVPENIKALIDKVTSQNTEETPEEKKETPAEEKSVIPPKKESSIPETKTKISEQDNLGDVLAKVWAYVGIQNQITSRLENRSEAFGEKNKAQPTFGPDTSNDANKPVFAPNSFGFKNRAPVGSVDYKTNSEHWNEQAKATSPFGKYSGLKNATWAMMDAQKSSETSKKATPIPANNKDNTKAKSSPAQKSAPVDSATRTAVYKSNLPEIAKKLLGHTVKIGRHNYNLFSYLDLRKQTVPNITLDIAAEEFGNMVNNGASFANAIAYSDQKYNLKGQGAQASTAKTSPETESKAKTNEEGTHPRDNNDRIRIAPDLPWITREQYVKEQIAAGKSSTVANYEFDILLDKLANNSLGNGSAQYGKTVMSNGQTRSSIVPEGAKTKTWNNSGWTVQSATNRVNSLTNQLKDLYNKKAEAEKGSGKGLNAINKKIAQTEHKLKNAQTTLEVLQKRHGGNSNGPLHSNATQRGGNANVGGGAGTVQAGQVGSSGAAQSGTGTGTGSQHGSSNEGNVRRQDGEVIKLGNNRSIQMQNGAVIFDSETTKEDTLTPEEKKILEQAKAVGADRVIFVDAETLFERTPTKGIVFYGVNTSLNGGKLVIVNVNKNLAHAYHEVSHVMLDQLGAEKPKVIKDALTEIFKGKEDLFRTLFKYYSDKHKGIYSSKNTNKFNDAIREEMYCDIVNGIDRMALLEGASILSGKELNELKKALERYEYSHRINDYAAHAASTASPQSYSEYVAEQEQLERDALEVTQAQTAKPKETKAKPKDNAPKVKGKSHKKDVRLRATENNNNWVSARKWNDAIDNPVNPDERISRAQFIDLIENGWPAWEAWEDRDILDLPAKPTVAQAQDIFDEFRTQEMASNKGSIYSAAGTFEDIPEDNQGNKLSDGQRKYFGRSKVRDELGRLLKLWHGSISHADQNYFDPQFATDHISFFAIDNKDVAMSYSGSNRERSLFEKGPIRYKISEMSGFELAEITSGTEYDEDGDPIEIDYLPADLVVDELYRPLNALSNRIKDFNAAMQQLSSWAQPSARVILNSYVKRVNEAGAGLDYTQKILAQANTAMNYLPKIPSLVSTHSSLATRLIPKLQDALDDFSYVYNDPSFREAYDNHEMLFQDSNGNYYTRQEIIDIATDKYGESVDVGFMNNRGNQPLYANLVNPLVVDAEGENWDRIADFDDVREYLEKIGNPADNDDFLYDENYEGTVCTNGVVRYAYDHGYDGVIFQNIEDIGANAGAGVEGTIATVVVGFRSNQFKDTQNLEPTEDPKFNYSIANQQYMDAVDSGDTDTAQQLVDNAAKRAGYRKEAFHGTPRAGFHEFWEASRNELGPHFGSIGTANQFYKNVYNQGNTGTPGIYHVYLRMRNTLRTPDIWGDPGALQTIMTHVDSWIENGYSSVADGVRFSRVDARKLKDALEYNSDYFAYQDAVNDWYEAARYYDNPEEYIDPVTKQVYTEDAAWDLAYEEAAKLGYSKAYSYESGSGKKTYFVKTKNGKTQDLFTLEAAHDGIPVKQHVIDAGRRANLLARKYLRNLGYDSVRYTNEIEGAGTESYIMLDPESIKLADPITYDDEGNVISLDERFNPETRDIRYSMSAVEYNDSKTETGDTLKTLGGSPIKRGGSLVGKRYPVGKVIGEKLYIHKDYLDTAYEANPELADIISRAESLLRSKYPDFEYRCISWSPKEQNVLFQEAPDFDTAREPRIGNGVKVDLKGEGTVGDMEDKDQIWHHKWSWVGNDYKGFNVRDSWEWSRTWLNKVEGQSKGGSIGVWNKQLDLYDLPHDEPGEGRFSLVMVEPIEPSSDKWHRTHTQDEAQEIYPNLWGASEEAQAESDRLIQEYNAALEAKEKEVGHKLEGEELESFQESYRNKRHPTQRGNTLATYSRIFYMIQQDHNGEFNGKILDASSGLGLGTDFGREMFGKDAVDDIEPWPMPYYQPRLGRDYSKVFGEYDAIISSAVLNVCPQDQRDALVVKMGQMLKLGGKMYITTRAGKNDVDNLGNSPENIKLDEHEYVETVHGAYQYGFTSDELQAYIQDALGSDFVVEKTKLNPSKKDPSILNPFSATKKNPTLKPFSDYGNPAIIVTRVGEKGTENRWNKKDESTYSIATYENSASDLLENEDLVNLATWRPSTDRINPELQRRVQNAMALRGRTLDYFSAMDRNDPLRFTTDEIDHLMEFNLYNGNIDGDDMPRAWDLVDTLSEISKEQTGADKEETYKLMADIIPHMSIYDADRWTEQSTYNHPMNPDFYNWYTENYPSKPVEYRSSYSAVDYSYEPFDYEEDMENREYGDNEIDSEYEVLSPAKRAFYINSDARDEDGHLLCLYHGTDAYGFTVWDPRYSDDKRSIFLTSDPDVARSYIRSKDKRIRSAMNIGKKQEPIDLNTLTEESLINLYNEHENGVLDHIGNVSDYLEYVTVQVEDREDRFMLDAERTYRGNVPDEIEDLLRLGAKIRRDPKNAGLWGDFNASYITAEHRLYKDGNNNRMVSGSLEEYIAAADKLQQLYSELASGELSYDADIFISSTKSDPAWEMLTRDDLFEKIKGYGDLHLSAFDLPINKVLQIYNDSHQSTGETALSFDNAYDYRSYLCSKGESEILTLMSKSVKVFPSGTPQALQGIFKIYSGVIAASRWDEEIDSASIYDSTRDLKTKIEEEIDNAYLTHDAEAAKHKPSVDLNDIVKFEETYLAALDTFQHILELDNVIDSFDDPVYIVNDQNYGKILRTDEYTLRKSIVDIVDSMGDENSGSGVYPVYANITRAYIIDANGSSWASIPVPQEVSDYIDSLESRGDEEHVFFDGYVGQHYLNTRGLAKYAKDHGYNGVIIRNVYDIGGAGYRGPGSGMSTVVIAFESNQVKDRMNENPTEHDDSRFSISTGGIDIELDNETESASPLYSYKTWSDSTYVTDRDNAVKQLMSALGVTKEQAEKYIDDLNSVARLIAKDPYRLDYEDTGLSPFVSNAEYGGSFDFTTLCKKRRLITGTFSAIQRALPNTALTASEVLRLRKMMDDDDLEVNCGKCYVEGSRAKMGIYTKEFLKLYEKYNPGKFVPNMAQMNTPDGVEWVRTHHPEVYQQYEYFWNHYGTLKKDDPHLFPTQGKPKLYQMRSAYKGEILKHFKNPDAINKKNLFGGIRMQSFSDFEIVHLLDSMQIILDMSRVGLAGQAYTKVPDFAWALGNTGLKINLSIDAWGVDENGALIFNNKEGMNFDTAMELRDAHPETVGTICCVYDDKQLLAALADNRIDYIIPFHRSQWTQDQYAEMGLPTNAQDYQPYQNESWLNPADHQREGVKKPDKCQNLMPNSYWDFNKTGKENAERYLQLCAETGRRPKFYKLLVDNGNGSYSLQPDGSTDGYWKLLIDFKMYDNDGKGVPQRPVQPVFDMKQLERMLNTYEGGHNEFPVAQDIVDRFVAEYKANHPDVSQYSVAGETFDVYGFSVDEELPNPSELTKSELSDKLYYSSDTGYYQLDSGEVVVIPDIGEDSPEAQYINNLEANNNANISDTTTTESYPIPPAARNGSNGYNLREQDASLRRGAEEIPTQDQEGTLRRAGSIAERNGQSGPQSEEQESLESLYSAIFGEPTENNKGDRTFNWYDEYGNTITTLDAFPINSFEYNYISRMQGSDPNLLEDLFDEYFKENGPISADSFEEIKKMLQYRDDLTEEVKQQLYKSIDEKRKKYGSLPKGKGDKKPNVILPKKTNDNTKIRKGIQTAASNVENDHLTDRMLYEAMTDELLGYTPQSNKKSIQKARTMISGQFGGNLDRAMDYFVNLAASGRIPRAEDIALADILIMEYSTDPNTYDKAIKVAADLSIVGTNLGQATQAMRIIKRATPEGQLYYLNGVINHLNNVYAKRIAEGKMPPIRIPEELADQLRNAHSKEEIDTLMNKIKDRIAEQIPSTIWDKWNAWRYLAMLGNPRTHIRNFLGNLAFMPAVFIKDAVLRRLQQIPGWIDPEYKMLTTDVNLSGWWRKANSNNAYVRFAQSDFEDMKELIGGKRAGNKFSDVSDIMSRRRIFNSEIMNKLEKGNSDLLSNVDLEFQRRYYVRSLAEALQAQGITEDQLANIRATKEGKTILNKARQYAMLQAQRDTYHELNTFAMAMNRFKSTSGPVGNILAEGLMPFVSTPANILVLGAVKYSPFTLARSIIQLKQSLKSGDGNTMQILDDMAAGLTGTGVMILGALLAAAGVLRGGGSGDDNKDKFEKLQGHQNWSIEIGFPWFLDGRKVSYTLDWMAPMSMPLFVGATFYELLSGELDLSSPSKLWSALMGLADPMLAMSMLDGLENTLSSLAYASDANAISTLAAAMFTSYFAQGMPTLLGQLARTLDEDRRATYIDKNSWVPGDIQRILQNSIQSKIPGIIEFFGGPDIPFTAENKMAYVDAWGRTDTNESLLLRALENFISPGYANFINETPVDQEIMRLYEELGPDVGKDILPDMLSKAFRVDGETKNLTAEEYEQLMKIAGSAAYSTLFEMIADARYEVEGDEQKAELMTKAYDISASFGKYSVDDHYALTNTEKTALMVGLADYILTKGELPEHYTNDDLFAMLAVNPYLTTDQIAGMVAEEFTPSRTLYSEEFTGYAYDITEEDKAAMRDIFYKEINAELDKLEKDPKYINADDKEKGYQIEDAYKHARESTQNKYAKILDESGRERDLGKASAVDKEKWGVAIRATEKTLAEQAKYLSDSYAPDHKLDNPDKLGWVINLSDQQYRDLKEKFAEEWEKEYETLINSDYFRSAETEEDRENIVKAAFTATSKTVEEDFARGLNASGYSGGLKPASDFGNEDDRYEPVYNEDEEELDEELGEVKAGWKWTQVYQIALDNFDTIEEMAAWMAGKMTGASSVDNPDQIGHKMVLDSAQKATEARHEQERFYKIAVTMMNDPAFKALTFDEKAGALHDLEVAVAASEERKYAQYLLDKGIHYEDKRDVTGSTNQVFFTMFLSDDLTTDERLELLDQRYTSKVGTSIKGHSLSYVERAHRVDAYMEYIANNFDAFTSKYLTSNEEADLLKAATAFEKSYHKSGMSQSGNITARDFGITTKISQDQNREIKKTNPNWSFERWASQPFDFDSPLSSYAIPAATPNPTKTPSTPATTTPSTTTQSTTTAAPARQNPISGKAPEVHTQYVIPPNGSWDTYDSLTKKLRK